MVLSAKQRLPRSIGRLSGQRFTGRHLDLIIAPNHLGRLRARVIIPKRLVAKAVTRNRFRRQLLHCLLTSTLTTQSLDVILIVRRNFSATESPCEHLSVLLTKTPLVINDKSHHALR